MWGCAETTARNRKLTLGKQIEPNEKVRGMGTNLLTLAFLLVSKLSNMQVLLDDQTLFHDIFEARRGICAKRCQLLRPLLDCLFEKFRLVNIDYTNESIRQVLFL
jgi:hypothetical protein